LPGIPLAVGLHLGAGNFQISIPPEVVPSSMVFLEIIFKIGEKQLRSQPALTSVQFQGTKAFPNR
jgi:hypothetical protein